MLNVLIEGTEDAEKVLVEGEVGLLHLGPVHAEKQLKVLQLPPLRQVQVADLLYVLQVQVPVNAQLLQGFLVEGLVEDGIPNLDIRLIAALEVL